MHPADSSRAPQPAAVALAALSHFCDHRRPRLWIKGLHAMSARHWMIGCLIGLAGMGSAMATDMDARDITAGSHGATDSSARDAGSTSGGDALGLSRDCPSSRHSSDNDTSDASDTDSHNSGSAAGGSEHGGRISAPTSARPATLGWQSLLPGSIQ
jgi:hypothetical protein